MQLLLYNYTCILYHSHLSMYCYDQCHEGASLHPYLFLIFIVFHNSTLIYPGKGPRWAERKQSHGLNFCSSKQSLSEGSIARRKMKMPYTLIKHSAVCLLLLCIQGTALPGTLHKQCCSMPSLANAACTLFAIFLCSSLLSESVQRMCIPPVSMSCVPACTFHVLSPKGESEAVLQVSPCSPYR